MAYTHILEPTKHRQEGARIMLTEYSVWSK